MTIDDQRTYNVLFLCTGNSARSILAESILNLPLVNRGRFRAFSAGSHPTGTVSSHAIALLEKNRIPTDRLRSKSWEEFAVPDAPIMDFVFTVCDQAAGEVCPVWPGQPMTAHWGIEDPAAFQGNEEAIAKTYFTAFSQLQRRIALFSNLPLTKLAGMALQRELDAIGKLREQGQ